MQWEELLYTLSMYQKELFIVLACLIFLLGVIKDNKKPSLRLLKVEYSSSPRKNKKYKIKKYYLDEKTGRIKILEEHTNDKIIDKSNWD